MLTDPLLTQSDHFVDIRPCIHPIGLKLRNNHIVTDTTSYHPNHFVKRHRTLRSNRPLRHPPGDHRRSPNHHRRLTYISIGISLHLLLIVLLSLTLISLPLSLVTISLIPDQSTCDGTNSTPNQSPLGRLILVVVSDHPANNRPGKPPQEGPVSGILLPQNHRTGKC
jgi:hypothetical protein